MTNSEPLNEVLTDCVRQYVDVVTTIFDSDEREALSYEIYRRYLANLDKYRIRGISPGINVYTFEKEITVWLESLIQSGGRRAGP